MSLYSELNERSGTLCELCGADQDLDAKIVPPRVSESSSDHILACGACEEAYKAPKENEEYWRCLTDSAWNPEPAVQVVIYRLLKELEHTNWAQHTLQQMYLDDATQEWADAVNPSIMHIDSNGFPLAEGDTVVLIKDLDVKGANFVAKRGTSVKKIHLVVDNPEQIEGKVNDQHIVILTKFVRKS